MNVLSTAVVIEELNITWVDQVDIVFSLDSLKELLDLESSDSVGGIEEDEFI